MNRRELRNPLKPDGLEEVGVGTTGVERTIGTFLIPGDAAHSLQFRSKGSSEDETGEIRDMKPILRLEGEPVD